MFEAKRILRLSLGLDGNFPERHGFHANQIPALAWQQPETEKGAYGHDHGYQLHLHGEVAQFLRQDIISNMASIIKKQPYSLPVNSNMTHHISASDLLLS